LLCELRNAYRRDPKGKNRGVEPLLKNRVAEMMTTHSKLKPRWLVRSALGAVFVTTISETRSTPELSLGMLANIQMFSYQEGRKFS
jgi:hypothetical protein